MPWTDSSTSNDPACLRLSTATLQSSVNFKGTHTVYFSSSSQMALLFNINFYFDCKTTLCLIVPGRQEKYIFVHESFYLQGILDDTNEQDTSFLDCKHKHMMKSGGPPDKFGVLYRMVTQ